MKSVHLSNNTIIHFEDSALETLASFRQLTSVAPEAGGILLGKKLLFCDEYVVTEVTTPTPLDKQGRFFFLRNKKSTQDRVTSAWIESGGVTNYLGEWHTHPQKAPQPSSVDIKLIQRVINENTPVFPTVFLLILGNQDVAYLKNFSVSQGVVPKYNKGGILCTIME